jgi:hypothetical protein
VLLCSGQRSVPVNHVTAVWGGYTAVTTASLSLMLTATQKLINCVANIACIRFQYGFFGLCMHQ